MSVDLGLDPLTGDLSIIDNDLVLVNTSEQMVQNLKIRLRFFLGEWFLDTTQGLPLYESILVKNPNLPDIDNIIKAEIIDTEDITEILEYNSDYDKVARTYTISFKVRSIYGQSDLLSTSFGV